jgi:type II secretory pathway predicted ATPase ExeA
VQPLASLKALDDPIYEAFYGLSEQPFAISTDPRFFYLSASHQRAFIELLNGLRRRESLLLLTGETGTGKTTLCRAVIDALGERTFGALILNPYMAGSEVLRIVLRDFGLVSHEDLRRGALASADVPQLLDTLEGFLKSLVPLGSHAVIVLDEAQSLAPQILDQIRLLTALEYNGQRLVQVVLCGQQQLLATLKTEPLHALNERITRRVELAPLPADQVDGYINHRLGVAGGAHSVSFDAPAARVIAELSRGLPRRINVLCDRALQEGRVEGVSVITPDLVKRAARALAGSHEPVAASAPTAPQPPKAVAPTPEAKAPAHADQPNDTVAPEMPALSFGQEPEAAPERHVRRDVVLGLAALALLSGAGYAWYARTVLAGPPPEPPAPLVAPQRALGAPALALPVPSREEIEAYFGALLVGGGPAMAPPTAPESSAPPQPADPSAQLPDNRNQLD